MHINVCTVDSGWILQKIGERIVNNYNGNEANFTITKGCPPMPNALADVNYYVDIQSCFFGRKTKCDIGFFIKRARPAQTLFGDNSYHTDRFAQLSGY